MSSAYDSTADTRAHIERVQSLMFMMIGKLHTRRREHDMSKLLEPEKSVFDRETPKLRNLEYGSEEYKQSLERMKVALDHHYAHNSHHPEFAEMQEEWRDVVGYEGLYEVSSRGRVRTVGSIRERSGSRGSLTVHERIRKPHLTPKGYHRVQLSKDGVARNHLVHVLVAQAFIGCPDESDADQVNHKDGFKSNNCAENLEYVTQSENMLHAYEHGLKTSNAKYVFTCENLDISTVGAQKMEAELKERGYQNASAAGIWRASVGDGKSHLGMTFRAEPLAEAGGWSGMAGMSLLDLVEMLADWKAATERHATGDITKSIDMNAERFGYDDTLRSIFHNTVREMGWEISND